MKLWEKIILGTLASGAIAGGITYALRLKRTSAELETIPTATVHKLDLKGLTLRIDVLMKNPTRSALKIKFPFVKLIYKGVTIGSSQAVDKDITLPAFGQAQISQIMVSIPILNLLSTSATLIKSLQGKQPVAVQVRTITTLDLGWKKLPYDKTDTVTIGKAQAKQPVNKQLTQ